MKKHLTLRFFITLTVLFTSTSLIAQRTLTEERIIKLRTQSVSQTFLKQLNTSDKIGIDCSKSTIRSALLEGAAGRGNELA